MDVQYFGGNCIVLSGKGVRLVVDDNLAELGLKPVAREGDIVLQTFKQPPPLVRTLLTVDGPGEYEISNFSIKGIATRSHMDEPNTKQATIYRVMVDDVTYLFTGHVYPQLNDDQLESIGMVDVMFVPVGGNGYTLDATGALQLVKAVEPKVVVPTHYDDPQIKYPVPQRELTEVLKNIGMEPADTVAKLRYKPSENNGTQLVIINKS